MSALPTQGRCEYNGYLFPVEHETLSLVATPVQDAAKRTVVYVVYSITIRFYAHVAAPSNMNSTMDTIRKQLTAQAGAFYYVDKGLGDISVNIPNGTKRDVLWGPSVKMLKLRQIGINAVEGVWHIDVAIPECANASFAGRIMEFNFKVAISIDTSGYSKRTYSGHIRIPMTRNSQSDRTLPDSVDRYREDIYPALVPGFRRIPGEFTIDESKTRMDFQITDVEVGPNYPPPGVVDVRADHSYSNAPGKLFEHTGTIIAEYEIIRGLNTKVALNYFKELVASRLKGLKTIAAGPIPDAWKAWGLPQIPALLGVIPMQFSASEPEIYGKKKARFSLTYMVVSTVVDFMTAGLWRPAPSSNWSVWSKSMSAGADGAWKSRGQAYLKVHPDQDVLVDLCIPPPNVGTLTGRKKTDGNPPPEDWWPFKKPDPFASWLLYENDIIFEQRSSTIVHTPLAESKLQSSVRNDPGFNNQTGYQPGRSRGEPDSIIQERSAPQYYLIMKGRACRVGFEIPAPRLLQYGGVKAFSVDGPGDGFRQGIVGNVGVPIYFASWRLRYALPRAPFQLSAYPIPAALGSLTVISGGRG